MARPCSDTGTASGPYQLGVSLAMILWPLSLCDTASSS